jgi:hypothetical protein
MVTPIKLNIKIYQGSTFSKLFRWESNIKGYNQITAISKTAPMVVTAPAHGIPVGWRTKLTNIVGMKEVANLDYITPSSVTTDTLTFNSINSASYSTYTGSGILEYNRPVDLTGITARMQIREKITSNNFIVELTTENGLIQVDNTLKTITFTIPAATTQAFTFKQAVYSLELVKSSVVIPFANGTVSLVQEVTR